MMLETKLFIELGKRKGFEPKLLDGGVLLLTRLVDPKKPVLMVISGFHGDEIGGPAGVKLFLSAAEKESLDGVNLSIIPIVNDETKDRSNESRLDTNRTAIHEDGKRIAWQSQILMRHLDLISMLARDGCLTLHEDVDAKGFYVYSFGDRKAAERLKSWGASIFGLVPDSTSKGPPNDARGPVKDGMIVDKHDSSFEDLLSHANTKFVVATETPGKAPLKVRAKVNALSIALAMDIVTGT